MRRRRLRFRCNLWFICVNCSIHSLFGCVFHRRKLEMLMSHPAGSLGDWMWWYHSIRWNTRIASNNWWISFGIQRPFLNWRINEFINRKWWKNCSSISSIDSLILATKCLIHSPRKDLLKSYFKIVGEFKCDKQLLSKIEFVYTHTLA